MKISFVILHYMSLKDTMECITSIKQNIITKEELSIIVVDNASPDQPRKSLLEQYQEDDNIYILCSEKNLGFANGNNLGFNFAKYNLKSDFIILLNNDTVIEDSDFVDGLVQRYEEDKFDIAGPCIVSLTKKESQNPIASAKFSLKSLRFKIYRLRILNLMSYFNVDVVFQKIYNQYLKKSSDLDEKLIDFQLHGCCLCFTKNYINKFDGLYNKTFMYCEEDILKYSSIREGLKMSYIDNITVIHKEEISTNLLFDKKAKKRRFVYHHSIQSYLELLQMMKDGNNEN